MFGVNCLQIVLLNKTEFFIIILTICECVLNSTVCNKTVLHYDNMYEES